MPQRARLAPRRVSKAGEAPARSGDGGDVCREKTEQKKQQDGLEERQDDASSK
jgi:hypothetical protein